MNVSLFRFSAVVLVLGTVGCQTAGTGHGTVRNGTTSVNFEWKSQDNVSGTMTARFADGRVYSGQYFHITSEARIDQMGSLWMGWPDRYGGWPYWHPQPGPAFIRNYSGRVLANLADANGDHLRCRFRLVHPAEGLSGGGQGTCQMSDGKTLDTTLAASP